jgi:hypothetical protein
MAMGRVNAILTSFVYQGLSLVTGIQNMIQFIFFVVMIILVIMIALLIILFFILFPFIPILITPVIVLLIAGGAAAASGMNDSFCFEPSVPVVLATGATKPISEIQIGDVLAGGNSVEGVLRMDGSATNLYELEGIRVSGSHLVSHSGKWHSVSEDPRSVPSPGREPVLYCLNTSNRLIPVQTKQGTTVLFRDWEEIEKTDVKGQETWDYLVSKILGGVSETRDNDVEDTFCLMDGANTVVTESGIKSLNEIVLGEKLQLSYNRYTTVLGLVEGRIKGTGTKGWMSACIEKEYPSVTGKPYRRITTIKKDSTFLKGRHLITDSGEFFVNINGTVIHVRDFTEVGSNLIHLTYPLVAKNLNKTFISAANTE